MSKTQAISTVLMVIVIQIVVLLSTTDPQKTIVYKNTSVNEKLINSINNTETKPLINNYTFNKESIATKTLMLESSNTVSIKGPITQSSMALAMTELQEKASKLDKEDDLYLFMDTGGGSIFAGLDFIDFANSLPNNIVTVTKFAASMGFQIVQNMGKRYITPSGILMSHRATGGVEGQFDGELESQYKMIKEQIDRMDVIASARMEISYADYKSMIINEFWSNGFRSVNNKSADEVVNVRCGDSFVGSSKSTINTMFGPYEVELSKCPLIRGFISVKSLNKKAENLETTKMLKESYSNPSSFLKNYVKTNEIYKYMR